MKACKHPGICKLCNQYKELTFEHVPPQNAFNSVPVMYYSFEEAIRTITDSDRAPWDYDGLKGYKQQRGSGSYYLCRDCNSNTGTWYIREYTEFVNIIATMIANENVSLNSLVSFEIKNRFPLRIYKAIMTMFCDINFGCIGNDSLRPFLLEKESMEYDSSHYELFMYLVNPAMKRISGVSGVASLNEQSCMLVSEISSYPVGLILYIDRPSNTKPFGYDISFLQNYSYDTQCNLRFDKVPYIELNSQIPLDFRRKEEYL